jgi:hypothetical protein
MSWRLVCDIDAYIGDDNTVVFAPTVETKRVLSKYIKHISGHTKKVILEDPQFSLSITDDLKILCKSDELPEWCTVKNFADSTVGRIISQNLISKTQGQFDSQEFEIIINNDEGFVSFVTSEMKEYDDCYDEMNRQLYFSIGKKVKKLIVGHKYYSSEDSFYYLGTFLSRKTGGDVISDFETNVDSLQKVYLIYKGVAPRDGSGKISDILKSNYPSALGNLRLVFKLGSVVDGGKGLIDDVPDIRPYFECIIQNALGQPGVNPLEILSIWKKDWEAKLSEDIVELILKYYKDLCVSTLISEWDVVKSNMISKANTEKDNLNNLQSKTCALIDTNNVWSGPFYQNLFQYFGIDIQAITSQVLKTIENPINYVFSSWETYSKYYEIFFANHFVVNNRDLDQTVKKSNKIQPITELLGEGPLSEAIKFLLDEARENKVILSSFVFLPKAEGDGYFIRARVTLADIINNINLTDDLKKDIIKKKFNYINVSFDENAEIIL